MNTGAVKPDGADDEGRCAAALKQGRAAIALCGRSALAAAR